MVPQKKVKLKDGIGQNCGLTSRCSFQTAVTSLDKSSDVRKYDQAVQCVELM